MNRGDALDEIEGSVDKYDWTWPGSLMRHADWWALPNQNGGCMTNGFELVGQGKC